MRRELTKGKIYDKIREIYEKFNGDISCSKLFKLVSKEFNCTFGLIKYRYGNFDNMLKELDINIKKNYIDLEARKGISENEKRSDKISESLKKIVGRNHPHFKEIKLKQIEDNIKEIFKKEGRMTKTDFLEKKSKICSPGKIIQVLKESNITLEELAKRSGLEFITRSESFSNGNHPQFKKITLNEIKQNLQNIVKYEGNISKNEFRNNRKRNFSFSVMRKVLNFYELTLDDLSNIVKVEFLNKKERWKTKEKLGLELCKELYGEGNIHLYYRGIGRPDFIPKNINKPIIDVKSTLGDISISQKEKYEKIRDDVRFMVFENKGKTNLPEDKILFMIEIIKTLPEGKRLIFQEKYEKIKNNISPKQMILEDFVGGNK